VSEPAAESTPESTPEQPSIEAIDIEIDNQELLYALSGAENGLLKQLTTELGVSCGLRGQTVRLRGAAGALNIAKKALDQLIILLRKGRTVTTEEFRKHIHMLRAEPELELHRVLGKTLLVGQGRRPITPKGLAQHRYVQLIERNDLVFGIGPAGTGKTYLAMAMAVRALLDKRVKRIVLTRPAVEAGEKLGFLPGDLMEKVNPYLRPLYDALHDMLEADRVQQLLQQGVIEVAPLAFMRGRTLGRAFVILDEAQNTTKNQMKMFLTRLGFDAKAVVAGDVTQVDLPSGEQSGLLDATQRLQGIEGIAIAEFSKQDVVRHPLVQRIVEAYESTD